MALTDLTNTKWLFNNSFPAQYAYSKEYNINFVTNNNNYNKIIIDDDGGEISVTISYYNGTTGFISYHGAEGGWQNEAYRTIEITGGTDVTNSNLISWLESNATQIASTVDIKLGNNTLLGVDTIALTDATDTSNTINFSYGVTPSGTASVKLGDNTLTNVNTLSVLGSDLTYKSFGYAAPVSGYSVTFAKAERPTFATMDAHRQYSLDGTTWNNIALAMDGTSLENVTSIYFRVNGNGSNTANISWTNPTGSLSPDLDYTSTWKTSGEVVLTGNMTATFGNSSNPE